MKKTVIIIALVLAPLSVWAFFKSDALPRTGKINSVIDSGPQAKAQAEEGFKNIWFSDFECNCVFGMAPDGKISWRQYMAGPPITSDRFNVSAEYVTLAPDGNLLVSDGDGMMVNEIDRATHQVIWKYGIRKKQGYTIGMLEQPDKAYAINDHEILINDGNNRRVIIVDKDPLKGVVWQYGKTRVMSTQAGSLMGNTFAFSLDNGRKILITDTIQKKIIIVDRSSKKIIWQWVKPDALWLEHIFPTKEGTFVMEDRQKNEVFEVNSDGKILWTLRRLSDGSRLNYPTDAVKLSDGDVLIADAGHKRIIVANPLTGQLVHSYKTTGFVSSIAVEVP
jgi:outer membrane protein assembly factor BamB